MVTGRVHRAMMGGATALGVLLAAGGIAFACTASATFWVDNTPVGASASTSGGEESVLAGESAQAGRAGSTVNLVGQWFREGSPVEIHWNSIDGPELAEVQAPTFRASVTIPQAQPGLHSIVAVQRGSAFAAGDSGEPAPAVQRAVAFEVLSPDGQSAGISSARSLYDTAGATGLAESLGGSQLAWASGLVAGGLVALAAGSAVALAGRKRALAHSRGAAGARTE